MAMYLGNQAVKILAPSINLFDKSLIQAHATDFPECSEYQVSADYNTVIAKGNENDYYDKFLHSKGIVRWGARSAYYDSKGIKLKNGDTIIISADVTLIEKGNRAAQIACFVQSQHPYIEIKDNPLIGKDISETTQRLNWTIKITQDGDDFYPCFALNSNKVKFENISVNKVKDYWRIRSGVNMGRNPKNLIPFPYMYLGNPVVATTKNGITFTPNEDGTITANGTATAQAVYYLFHEVDGGVPIPIEKRQYYSTDNVDGETTSTHYLNMSYVVEDGSTKYKGAGVKTLENGRLRSVYIVVAQGTVLNNVTFKPMLNEGIKALPYFYYD